MPTDGSIAANKVARAIFLAAFLISMVVIVMTFMQQRFIIDFISDIEMPPEIRFVNPEGQVVICHKQGEIPEYVCRREQ